MAPFVECVSVSSPSPLIGNLRLPRYLSTRAFIVFAVFKTVIAHRPTSFFPKAAVPVCMLSRLTTAVSAHKNGVGMKFVLLK